MTAARSLVGQGIADAVPAHLAYGGATPSGRTPTAGMQPVAGGVAWEGEPRRCSASTKSGHACGGFAVEGDDVCQGHRRARERQQKGE